jgi:SAM-dependent methyltransferase
MSFESRFGQAADAYQTFRPDYPPEIFRRILAWIPADEPRQKSRDAQTERYCAIDLGAGTGKASRELAKSCREVIAIEPDPLMVEKLREAAPGATIIQITAAEYEREPSSADLINFAQSLHWMDIPRVLEKGIGWLRNGGILAVYGFGLPEAVEPVREIVRLELREHWSPYRDERLRRKHFPQCMVYEQAGVRVVEDVELSHSCKMTPAEFAGFWRSTSYGGAYGRSLEDPEVYWQDLESRFRTAWKEDKIPVDFKPYLLIAGKEQ